MSHPRPAHSPATTPPAEPQTTKAWVIYTRVSTDEQALHGVSLDAQLEQCRAMLTAMRLPLLEVISDDGYSGETIAKRPGMRRIVEMMDARTIGGVVVSRLDRLSRSITDMDLLIKKINRTEVGLLSVGETIDTRTPNGRMFVYLSGLFAQWEREKIADRVRTSMAHIRAKGFFCGGRVPTGCALEGEKGKRRLVRGEHADLVAQAWPMVKSGASLLDVAAYLNHSGVPLRGNQKSRKEWGSPQVSRLLRTESVIDVLVDAALFKEVRATLDARRNPFRQDGQTLPSHRTDRVWITAGILRCGSCGATLCGMHSRGKSGKLYPYLRCVGRNKGRCKARDLPAEAVERALIAGMVNATRLNGDYAKKLMAVAREVQGQAQPILDRKAALAAERVTLAHKRDTLLDLAGEPGIVRKVLAERLNAIQAQIDGVELELARCDGELAACRLTEEEATVIADSVSRYLSDLPSQPPEQQREALTHILKSAKFDMTEPDHPTLHVEVFVPAPPTTTGAPVQGAGEEFVQNSALVLPQGFEPWFTD